MLSEDRGKILIVEDDGGVRQALASTLQAEGFEIVAAADGMEGLRLLEKNPDTCAIVLDLMMPGMNGWEFRIAQWRLPALAALPVVLVTAIVSRAQTSELLQASACLQKPIDMGRLIGVLDELCAQRRQLQDA